MCTRRLKSDICLSSIAGGTDIIGCFALGSPVLPVHRGELQTRSLGYAVDVFDDLGEPITESQGELVCKAPFPSMPIYFWNDPDGERYQAAYFNRFKNTWHHGDYVMLTKNNGMIFLGRSDAVLNPGGVRIGTAEIYRQLERVPEITSSVVVGQSWKQDERVVLFVVLKAGLSLDDHLKQKIRTTIKADTTPRHAPKKIVQVSGIPTTRSGKISEIAVKKLIHGLTIQNTEALSNPESIDFFIDLPELGED